MHTYTCAAYLGAGCLELNLAFGVLAFKVFELLLR
jgi:hypothetical protein